MTALAHAIRQATAPCWPLVEMTKPRLSSLVLFATLAGYGSALSGSPDPWVLAHLLIGTSLVAGGANAFNQILERDKDALMERTRNRPLPTHRVGLTESVRFTALISIGGMLELLFGVNLLTAFLGALALGLYVFVYTPLKEMTVHNTLVGAVVGAIPPMMGWTAARGEFGIGGWTLCAILFVWQLPHFFSIAWMYRDDYRRGGYRMLSVADETGQITRRQVAVLALLLIPVSLMPTVLGVTGPLYFNIALLLGVAFCVSCVWTDPHKQNACARRSFIASIIYLPCLLILFMMDKV